MSDEGMVPSADSRLIVMRIIHGALLMGCLIFAAIVLFVPMERGPQAADLRVLVYVGYGFAALAALAYAVVPNLLVAGWRRSVARGSYPLASYPVHHPTQAPPPPLGSDAHWWGLYQTQMIIGAALLEGCIFFQLIAYWMAREPANLVLAGVFGLVLAGMFPTRSRIERWVATQKELVDQAKRTGA